MMFCTATWWAGRARGWRWWERETSAGCRSTRTVCVCAKVPFVNGHNNPLDNDILSDSVCPQVLHRPKQRVMQVRCPAHGRVHLPHNAGQITNTVKGLCFRDHTFTSRRPAATTGGGFHLVQEGRDGWSHCLHGRPIHVD